MTCAVTATVAAPTASFYPLALIQGAQSNMLYIGNWPSNTRGPEKLYACDYAAGSGATGCALTNTPPDWDPTMPHVPIAIAVAAP